MEDVIKIVKMWYQIFEPFDTDVKSSIIESTIDTYPSLMFDVALYCFVNKATATSLKDWICHKDYLGDLKSASLSIKQMDKNKLAELRQEFIISVNEGYVLRFGNHPDKGMLLF